MFFCKKIFLKNFKKGVDNTVSVVYNSARRLRKAQAKKTKASASCGEIEEMDSYKWKFSSAGRASALQAEGHRFDPCNFHQSGPVVQLVRTLACHARGRGFEPLPGRHFF